MKDLIKLLENQPTDFRIQWTFEGTKHFISHNEQFVASKSWLMQLMMAMGVQNRAVIVNGLKAAAESFTAK